MAEILPRPGPDRALLRSRFVASALALSLLGVCTSQARFSDAAFTAAARSNANNSLSAASSFTRDIASGTYTGNGLDNRNITGLGFQPDIVMIKATTASGTVIRTRTMTGDASKPLFGATALSTNRIQALQDGGFQIGTDATVNTNGTIYQWYAGTTSDGLVSVGSYTGNGLASRTISDPGYSPDALILLSAGAHAPVLRLAPMTTSFRFETGTSVANAITAFVGSGFTLGNSTSANTNNTVYHWIALNEVAGSVDVGSYTGDNTASRTISGLGLQPALTLVRSSSTTTSRAGVWRPSAVTDTASLNFSAAANITNGITAMSSGSFQIGNNASVNASSNPYAYLSIVDPVP